MRTTYICKEMSGDAWRCLEMNQLFYIQYDKSAFRRPFIIRSVLELSLDESEVLLIVLTIIEARPIIGGWKRNHPQSASRSTSSRSPRPPSTPLNRPRSHGSPGMTSSSGFGVRVQPTGLKSYFVNYRANGGGRKAPNKRVVLGRHGRISAEQARRMAHRVLGEVAGGGDPAEDRTEARAMPVLEQAFEDYMAVNPNRAARTDKDYRTAVRLHLGDWLARPLDAIGRRDVEARFNRLMASHGWARANYAIYRCCVRSIAGPASMWTDCSTRSICGLPRAAGSIARCGARSPLRPRCCRAGWRASRPRSRQPWTGTHSGSGCIPGCGSTRCCRCDGSAWTGNVLSSGSTRPKPGSRWNCPSPGNWGPSSATVGRKAERFRTAGCLPRPPAARAISRTWNDTTSGSENRWCEVLVPRSA